MFLSLHVKFVWFQVVLMLDIGPRHFVGVAAINFIEVGSLLFEVTKILDCFRNNEETFEGLVEPKL